MMDIDISDEDDNDYGIEEMDKNQGQNLPQNSLMMALGMINGADQAMILN